MSYLKLLIVIIFSFVQSVQDDKDVTFLIDVRHM